MSVSRNASCPFPGMLHVRFPEWFPTNPSRLLGAREERPHCRAARFPLRRNRTASTEKYQPPVDLAWIDVRGSCRLFCNNLVRFAGLDWRQQRMRVN